MSNSEIKVRLFSASDGTCTGVFTFRLSIGEQTDVSPV
jgi:hypothetical protein